MKVHLAPLAFCQIIVCLVGIVACVVPATLLETGFWGAWTASDGSILPLPRPASRVATNFSPSMA